jgi:hypothetical protein
LLGAEQIYSKFFLSAYEKLMSVFESAGGTLNLMTPRGGKLGELLENQFRPPREGHRPVVPVEERLEPEVSADELEANEEREIERDKMVVDDLIT